MFCIRRLEQSVGLLLDFQSFLFSKSSSLFIEDLRDVGNLAVASSCPSWSFDSSHLIFFLIWYLSYEELISNPFRFQRNNVCCNIVVILVLIWRQVAQKVVAETSAELVVIHFVHCPLSTLMKGASDEICFWWPLLLMTLLLITCLQELFFRLVSSDAVLQTHSSRCF